MARTSRILVALTALFLAGADIDTQTVSHLGFAWEYRTGTYRGLEATPIVDHGVMYTSGDWGIVYALDAATGRELWVFDPKTDGQRAFLACCDVVNRGVALDRSRVFVASTDARLFALDAKTGAKLWETDTIADHALAYTSTGAPRVAGDLVVIGNSGGDGGHHGVRGYVSAYDTATGALRWRFYTVPGPRGAPWPGMAQAARTWDPERDPNDQGGGTVWDGIEYDPSLDLVYIGTGNAAPYYRRAAATAAPYDDLFVASIVALHARTGQPAWHYQTTPGDIWDFDANAPMLLETLIIAGVPRKVLMQAAKNGFFYVLDRATGQVLSAKPFTHQNWTTGLDAHFRPLRNPAADYGKQPSLVAPSAFGGHNWQPMAFSPRTGLAYIPVTEANNLLVQLDTKHGASTNFIDGQFDVGIAVTDSAYDRAGAEADLGPLPPIAQAPGASTILRAWDPIAQHTVWQQQTWSGQVAAPGGVLATDGDLVFEGGADGTLRAYDARRGTLLKTLQTGTAIMAAPMTYRIDGVQYVAVMAGWGGGLMFTSFPSGSAPDKYRNDGRILAFRLNGAPVVPLPPPRPIVPVARPPVLHAGAGLIRRGEALFTTNCSRCHVFAPSIVPDLRRPGFGSWNRDVFGGIVLHGALAQAGMGSFAGVLSVDDADAIYAYVNDMSWQAYRAQSAAGR